MIFDLDWLWVLFGLRNPNCIYTEQELRNTINTPGGVATLCAVCDDSEIVKLTSEIDITGKNFSIQCLLENDNCNPGAACMIQGSVGHRLFSGVPEIAQFESIGFSFGEADEGGVFHLTGGTTNLTDCRFTYNKATGGDGGALFVSGPSTKVTLTGTGESTGNTATSYGGFLVATDGATVVIDGINNIVSRPVGITLNRAEESGGFVAARNGAKVEVRNMVVHCGNQAQNGGDYLYISDDASAECQEVDFQVLATSTLNEVPPPFNSTVGIIGTSSSCKSSMQVGEVECKRW